MWGSFDSYSLAKEGPSQLVIHRSNHHFCALGREIFLYVNNFTQSHIKNLGRPQVKTWQPISSCLSICLFDCLLQNLRKRIFVQLVLTDEYVTSHMCYPKDNSINLIPFSFAYQSNLARSPPFLMFFMRLMRKREILIKTSELLMFKKSFSKVRNAKRFLQSKIGKISCLG